MSPYDLSLAVAALANTIACHLSEKDLELAIILLQQLLDTLKSVGVQRKLLAKRCESAAASNTETTSTSSSKKTKLSS